MMMYVISVEVDYCNNKGIYDVWDNVFKNGTGI